MKIIKEGSTVTLDYRGTLADGTEFDSSYSRGEKMICTVGNGSLIDGFERALIGMAEGEKKSISVDPVDAYGEYKEGGEIDIPKSSFHENFEPKEGAMVYGVNDSGEQIIATIVSFDAENIKLDFNHPMAGKTLNFEIAVENIE